MIDADRIAIWRARQGGYKRSEFLELLDAYEALAEPCDVNVVLGELALRGTVIRCGKHWARVRKGEAEVLATLMRRRRILAETRKSPNSLKVQIHYLRRALVQAHAPFTIRPVKNFGYELLKGNGR